MRLIRTLIMVCALAMPGAVFAGEQPAGEAAAAAQPCPYADKGGCCGGACMQEAQAKAAEGEAAAMPADCPCKRRAKEAAAKAAAEKQQ